MSLEGKALGFQEAVQNIEESLCINVEDGRLDWVNFSTKSIITQNKFMVNFNFEMFCFSYEYLKFGTVLFDFYLFISGTFIWVSLIPRWKLQGTFYYCSMSHHHVSKQ